MSVVEVDRAGLEVLDRAACLALLATARVGRIAVTSRALPVILPVRYVLHDEQIVIRTLAGGTLADATRGAVVAFEADGPPAAAEPGWSVLVHGVARHLSEARRPRPDAWPTLPAWAPGSPQQTVLISTDQVTGRRLPAAQVTAAPRR